MFDGLVKEGLDLESTTRKATAAKVNVVRGAVEGTVGQVQAKASDSWGKLEKVFEDRVSRALTALGVPTAEDLQTLTRQIEELQGAVKDLQSGAEPAAKKTSKSRVKKAVTKAPMDKTKANKKKVLRKKTSAKKSSI